MGAVLPRRRTKVHWLEISTLTTLKAEATPPITARRTQRQATAGRWCSSGLDKMTIGTRSLSTIENYTNSRKKKPNRKNYMIKRNCVNFCMNKWSKWTMFGRWKSKRITSSWKTCFIRPNRKLWKRRRIPIRKGGFFKRSTKSVANNRDRYWSNGRMIGSSCMIITMKCSRRIRRRKSKRKMSEPNCFRLDCKLLKKMLRSIISPRQMRDS